MATNRLLVLDDETAIGSLIVTAAERVGYVAEAASDFDGFKDAFDRVDPTHVMLDLQLPDVDGVEVLSYLSGRQSRARIVLMSGFDARVLRMVEQVAQARGLEVVATCSKPLRIDDLKAILRTNAYQQPLQLGPEDIDLALDQSEIFMNYQPKRRLFDHKIIGFEALARWRHPDFDLIPPDQFIPIAERTGRIGRLTHHVFEMAIEGASRLQGHCEGCSVAINVSPLDLSETRLADDFAAICASRKVSPDSIILEMTESAAMSDPTIAKEALVRLRLKGFSISLDDFGTGYSSLVLLRQMPLSELKIDRSFVKDCISSRDSEAIVEAVVAMAHALGLSVVAEGVETEEVLDYLRRSGVDTAQGFLISPPVELEEAFRQLSQGLVDSK